MKAVLALGAALLVAGAPVATAAQPPGEYWQGDLCHQQKHEAASRGTFIGAIFGGVFGWVLAGRGHRAAGAAIGGSAGALAGHAIGEDSVECLSYPLRVNAHEGNCHWVSEFYDGAQHEFEVCRESDGVWRPTDAASGAGREATPCHVRRGPHHDEINH